MLSSCYTNVNIIDNGTVYDVLVAVLQETDLHACVKKFNTKKDSWKTYNAVHQQCPGPGDLKVTASEAESVLQTSTYGNEKNGLNLKKCGFSSLFLSARNFKKLFSCPSS